MEEFEDPMSTEDYMIEQLKQVVQRRQSSMDRIKQVYKDDPRANMTPFMAGLEDFVARPTAGGRGTSSYAELMNGMKNQREFLFQNKLQPELLQQKHDEADPFSDMLRKVQAKKAAYKPDVKVVGGSLVKYDPASDSTQVLFSDVKNSPLYGKIWDQIYNSSLKENMEFKNDAERRAYVNKEAAAAFADAVSKDSTVIGPQTPPMSGGAMEAPKGPLTNATQIGRPVPIGMTPAMARPGVDLRKESAVKGAMENAPGGIPNPNSPNIFGDPVGYLPEGMGGKKPAPLAAVSEAQPKILTARDLAVDKKLADAEVTDYTTTKEQLSAFRSANENIRPMEGIILSGKHTSGALHETLNKVGGYFNYIDPNGKLAESAGNDAAYFGNMMNLVRDKIKALGAGTAVSNLDLIVTQKSVGDLRNTPQGNMKVLGLTKLFNASMGAIGQGKVDYFDANNKLQGYKAPTEPTHAIRARRNPYGKETIMSYDVQSKDEWVTEQKRRNPGKDIPPDVLNREWKRFADDSVKAMFK